MAIRYRYEPAPEDVHVGDVLAVMSGGPDMTVESVSGRTVRCLWFAEGKLKRAEFSVRVLCKRVEV